jgi:hypothetical protein
MDLPTLSSIDSINRAVPQLLSHIQKQRNIVLGAEIIS